MADYQGITRTVCIGIGGTGEKVLTQIRKIIVDRYGSLDKLPVVSFVQIDTDDASISKGVNNYRGKDISFRETELVKAVVSASEAKAVSEGLQEVYRNPNTLKPQSHISKWFPPQLAKNIPAIEKGAQARRPIGRLAFTKNYEKFQQTIAAAVERTDGHASYLLSSENKLKLDPGINFFIVTSLCGGTGSGMFLDVAYGIRGLYSPNQVNSSIRLSGYLVISPQIYGNTPRQYANCYAALKELDYYSSEHTIFEICYAQNDYRALVREPRPPFDFPYIISRDIADTGSSISTREKLFNIIAQKITLDFSNELSPRVKSMRDNFPDYMQQWDKHPRSNCQHYMTFGLVSIYFPKERISAITQFEVACKLTEFWLGIGQSPDPQSLIDQFLVNHNWHPNLDKKNGFVSSLEKITVEGDRTFKKMIESNKTALKTDIEQCKSESDRQKLTSNLREQINGKFRKVIHSDTEAERGEWITKLQKASPNIENQYKQDIKNFISELLNPSNLKFSIRNSRIWLEAMQTELENYRSTIENEITRLNEAKTLEDVQKVINSSLSNITEANEKFEMPFFSGGKNRRVKELAQSLINTAYGLIDHNFKLAIHQEALKISKSIISAIETHLKELNVLYNSCAGLSRRYQNLKKDSQEFNSEEIHGEAVFTDKDVERCYKILVPDGQEKANLIELTRNTLQAFGDEKSLIGLKNISENDLANEIPIVLAEFLSPRMPEFSGSVIKLFEKKYSSPESQRIRLGQIIKDGGRLLPLDLRDDYYEPSLEKSSRIVGFKSSDEREVENFKKILLDNQVEPSEHEATSKEDEVVITCEYAGFPLRIIRGIDNFKFQYDQQKRDPNICLHNAPPIIFPDIVPPEAASIQKLQDIFYPCLALGIIEHSENPQKLIFSYYNTRGEKDVTESLSPNWNFALAQIHLNRDIEFSMERRLEELINETNKSEWDSRYRPMLVRFKREVDDFTDRDQNIRSKRLIQGYYDELTRTEVEGVIEKFDRKVQDRLLEKQANNILLSAEDSEASNDVQFVDAEVISNSQVNTALEEDLRRIENYLRDGVIDPKAFQRMKEDLIKKYQS